MSKSISKNISEWCVAVIVIALILGLLTLGGVLITGTMVILFGAFIMALIYDLGLGFFSLLRRGVLRLGRRERRDD